MTRNIFCLSITFKFIFNWNIIFYNVVLISIVQQCELAICIHIYSPLLSLPPTPSHSSRLSQSTQLSSLWYSTTLDQLSVLHMVLYICQCYSLNLSHPLLPSLCPKVHSLCLCPYFHPTSRFISTIFLDSTYVHQYMIFVFLFLTYFTLYNRLQVRPLHQN